MTALEAPLGALAGNEGNDAAEDQDQRGPCRVVARGRRRPAIKSPDNQLEDNQPDEEYANDPAAAVARGGDVDGVLRLQFLLLVEWRNFRADYSHVLLFRRGDMSGRQTDPKCSSCT